MDTNDKLMRLNYINQSQQFNCIYRKMTTLQHKAINIFTEYSQQNNHIQKQRHDQKLDKRRFGFYEFPSRQVFLSYLLSI